MHVRELVLAQAAATNSNIIRNDWPQYDFPQIASFDLLDKAYHIAKELGMTTHVGNVLSSDVFYSNYFEKNIELGNGESRLWKYNKNNVRISCFR